MQFGDRVTQRATQRKKGLKGRDTQPEDDEDDGCAALLALQAAVYTLPKFNPQAKAGSQYASSQYEPDKMNKKKQKRASSSGDTGGENRSASSGGSAKDILYAATEEGQRQHQNQSQEEINNNHGDELSDMEVDVISETEKGCQVWFPPLPGDMDRRRLQRSGSLNQAFIPSLWASKVKLGLDIQMDSAPSDASWDFGLFPDTLNLHMMGGGMSDKPSGKWRSGSGSLNEDETEEGGLSPREALQHEGTGNKRRLIWSQDLHERFLAAIKKLGVKNAVPKAILNLMGVEVGWLLSRCN